MIFVVPIDIKLSDDLIIAVCGSLKIFIMFFTFYF